jgi:hypothetical protein
MKTTWALPIALGLGLGLACGAGADGAAADAGPVATWLSCPRPGALPFALADRAWRLPDNGTAATTQTRIKHQPSDVVGNPAVGFAYTHEGGTVPLATGTVLVRGIMARIEDQRGLFAEEITGELVSAWQYDDGVGWLGLGEELTGTFAAGDAGWYSIDSGAGLPPDRDVLVRYAVLNAEPSCATHVVLPLAAGRPFILTDIDGTLTDSDDEIIMQISDPTYDPLEIPAAGELMRVWSGKGYPIVYLTARPHLLRMETLSWLAAHGFPAGPVITTTDFVVDEAARVYKGEWVGRLIDELGWAVVAAYGNATSDIDAYADAGIAKAITFIVGPNAGVDGTVAIEGQDYAAHVQSYVMAQPDAPP